MQEDKNYYELIGLTPDASQEDIKKTYIKLAKRYHPDHNGNPDDRRMIALNQIYEILSDPVKKQDYDNRFKLQKKYDFTQGNEVKVTKQAKAQKIRTKGLGKKYTNSLLQVILWIIIAYLALYFIVNIGAMYLTLPTWLKGLFPL